LIAGEFLGVEAISAPAETEKTAPQANLSRAKGRSTTGGAGMDKASLRAKWEAKSRIAL
jgi:hypothetical protein